MLSAVCPSCSAPIIFRHAAAMAAVCESCNSTVAREGQDVAAVGKVAPFARDLSPIQVGVTGQTGKRSFQVAGVLRKARARVRWNEWFLVFDDGSTGWLAEGNAELQLFDGTPIPVTTPIDTLNPGTRIELGDRSWVVVERSAAKVAAAEGSLPWAVTDQSLLGYADLRSVDGRSSGTLDLEESTPMLWEGRVVSMPDLKLEGLRPITGWSDPILTAMAGPEIKAVRTLRCPNCGGSLSLRAPGQSNKLTCEYCGSQLGLDEEGDASQAVIISMAQQRTWKPDIALGSRGKLEGIEWQVIGAMQRAVRFEGEDYPWLEYLLYNPYRGFAWLTESSGHYSLVRKLPDVPAGASGRVLPNTLRYKGDRFKHFQSGRAEVRKALGEFTWEVHVGDEAHTDDYVCPPFMLSRERTRTEISWSIGTWLTPDQIGAAFSQRPVSLGVAPNQPNPYAGRKPWMSGFMFAGLLAALLIVVSGLVSATSGERVVLSQGWSTQGISTESVLVTDPFQVEDGLRRNLWVKVDSDLDRIEGQVHVALMNTDDGQVYLVPGSTQARNKNTAWLRNVSPGSYVARVEIARPPGASALSITRSVKLTVRQNKPWFGLVFPLLLYCGGGLLLLVILRSRFEGLRWSQSDYAS